MSSPRGKNEMGSPRANKPSHVIWCRQPYAIKVVGVLPASGVEETIPTWYQIGIYLGSISTTRPNSFRLRNYPLKDENNMPRIESKHQRARGAKAGGPDSPCTNTNCLRTPQAHTYDVPRSIMTSWRKKEFKSDSGWVSPVSSSWRGWTHSVVALKYRGSQKTQGEKKVILRKNKAGGTWFQAIL